MRTHLFVGSSMNRRFGRHLQGCPLGGVKAPAVLNVHGEGATARLQRMWKPGSARKRIDEVRRCRIMGLNARQGDVSALSRTGCGTIWDSRDVRRAVGDPING